MTNEYSHLIEQYNRENEVATAELKTVKRKIHQLGTLKLVVFVGGIAAVVALRHEAYWAIALAALAAVVGFMLLAVWQDRYFRRKGYLETSIKVASDEIAAINYDYSAFESGKEYNNPEHPFAHDIDLFGERSLFQSMNRTVTAGGERRLAHWLMHPLEVVTEIVNRQKAVAELSKLWAWRKDFRVVGLLNRGERNDSEADLKEWVDQPLRVYKYRTLRLLPYMVGIFNLVLLILAFAGVVSFTLFGSIFSILIGASFFFTSSITKGQAAFNKRMRTLDAYGQLIERIECLQPESGLLQDIRDRIANDDGQASAAIALLNKRMNALDQRNNLIVLILMNGLYFKELYAWMQVERWKLQYGPKLLQWVDAAIEMDALCSLANFCGNHPNYIFPTPTDTSFTLEGKALGHPLMNREKCVRNDIDVTKRPYFIIVTGANMAGKSTYLRTVCTNYMLACVGAPVWATSLTFSPAHLVTSLRTTDSLNDNESYFFAELKRLKFIIDKLKAGENLFIVLDEILKGTNSVDKQKGSLALIRQLLAQKANGIIATHDLILGSLREQFPNEIANFCFEADITNNELTFSYQMREGLAQNMNACFLMEKMGIAVAE